MRPDSTYASIQKEDTENGIGEIIYTLLCYRILFGFFLFVSLIQDLINNA